MFSSIQFSSENTAQLVQKFQCNPVQFNKNTVQFNPKSPVRFMKSNNKSEQKRGESKQCFFILKVFKLLASVSMQFHKIIAQNPNLSSFILLHFQCEHFSYVSTKTKIKTKFRALDRLVQLPNFIRFKTG